MKKILLIFLMMLFSISIVSAATHVQLMRYDPIPAQAGEYVDVWIKLQNKGDSTLEGAAIKFKPSYPFSLDPTEKEEIKLGTLESGQFSVQKYKIRVDKGAVEGENIINFEYKECSSCIKQEISQIINVIEAHTDFEIVVQELSKEGTSIAIANIGKNPANSITLKIPEQEDIEVKGISSTIIGNLHSGDYTIATYNLIPKKYENKLNVEIHYTDSLGERHKIVKTIQFMPKSEFYEIYNKLHGIGETGINIWFWITIILIAYIVIKKIKNRRAKKKKRK